jgi:hypothetical protein
MFKIGSRRSTLSFPAYCSTRLWFHSTTIPAQKYPSVSYARDFRLDDRPAGDSEPVGGMTNVDGLYALEDIEAGTIIFSENDMPDCELHRSSLAHANCEVVELEDGTSAVASIRPITAGEFFCVPESSDDEGSLDDDIDGSMSE